MVVGRDYVPDAPVGPLGAVLLVGLPPASGVEWAELAVRSCRGSVCRARGGRASNSSMAHACALSRSRTGARPGCGSLRNRCGESDPPAVKHWLRPLEPGSSRWRIRSTCCRDGLRRAMCAIEAGRTRRPSHLQYHTRHSSLRPRAVPPVARSLASLVPWFRDGSGMGVEPTLRESSQDRRFDWSKPGAGHLQAGQHVVGSDQRCLMRQRHG